MAGLEVGQEVKMVEGLEDGQEVWRMVEGLEDGQEVW